MPTYEYRCKACGHELEVVQAFTDDALTTCPTCEASELRKVFGSVGISFKGSGFYKNDSRGKTSSTTSSSSTGDSATSTKSADTATSSDSTSSTKSTPSTPSSSSPSSDAKSA